jgi:antitoxin VapB
MPLNIRSEEVNAKAQRLAKLKGVSKTEAVRRALDESLEREETKLPLRERVKPIQDWILSHPPTGLEADKAFFDELSGD